MKMEPDPTQLSLNFDSHLECGLRTKKIQDFPNYLLLHALAEVCTRSVLLVEFTLVLIQCMSHNGDVYCRNLRKPVHTSWSQFCP